TCGAGHFGHRGARAMAHLAAEQCADDAAADHADIAAVALDFDDVDGFDHAAIGTNHACGRNRRAHLAGAMALPLRGSVTVDQGLAQHLAAFLVTDAEIAGHDRIGRDPVAIPDGVGAFVDTSPDFFERDLARHAIEPDARAAAWTAGKREDEIRSRREPVGRIHIEAVDSRNAIRRCRAARPARAGTLHQRFIEHAARYLVAVTQVGGGSAVLVDPVPLGNGVDAFVDTSLD